MDLMISTSHLRVQETSSGRTRIPKFYASVFIPHTWVGTKEAGVTVRNWKSGRHGCVLCAIYLSIYLTLEQWSAFLGSMASGFIVGEWTVQLDCLHRSCPSDPAARFLGRALLGSGALPKILYLKKKFENTGYVVTEVNKALLVLNHLIIGSWICSAEVRKRWGGSGTFSFESKRKHLAGAEENDIPAWPLFPFTNIPFFLPAAPLSFTGQAVYLLPTAHPPSIFFQFYEVNFLLG